MKILPSSLYFCQYEEGQVVFVAIAIAAVRFEIS